MGLLALATEASAQAPAIHSFAANPANIHSGQVSTLTWIVSNATSVSINPDVGPVSGTSTTVSPTVTTLYTLTATNASGGGQASTTVTVSPYHYLLAYDSALQGSWIRSCWESGDGAISNDFSATAPGRTEKAIEVSFIPSWNAFGLADRKPGWDRQFKYFNEFRTLEFDLYFESDSTGAEFLDFILEDAFLSDELSLADLIPGWSGLSDDQRYGHWFHVTVDLAQIHPRIPRFHQFLLFNDGDYRPHFRLAEVKLGWLDDTTPPVVTLVSTLLNPTYDQLTLAFSTDEATLYRVEYGVTNYGIIIQGASDNWNTNHNAVLTNLTPGITYRYLITALDHRTDTNASPNEGYYTNTYRVPSRPVTPPLIFDLAVTNILGNRATITWSNDRPCSARLTYRKFGGAGMTRTLSDLASRRAAVLDLLEPSTAYTVAVAATDAFLLSSTQSLVFTTGAAGTPSVTIAVNPDETRLISPWIYGINFYHQIPDAPRNLTLNRMGGNRWTAYNWENNASCAGSDWYYSNDGYLGGGETPAEAVRDIVEGDRARGNASLMTIQLQGYVAADKDGNVDIDDPNHIAARFKQAVYRKDSPFIAPPATNDAAVYMDEFLWALREKFANDIYADPVTPTFVSLDNEPELWTSTHYEIQPIAPTPEEYIQKTIDLSKALKDVAPAVKLFGPAHYGFNGIVNWQNAPGFTFDYWFTDKYLQELKSASDMAGKRLLDAYDIHWYSEATAGGIRIGSLTGDALTDGQIQAIVQSPRSLWDTAYRENSWVADYLGGPIYILGRLQAKIDANWPGTKLAVTEYGNGGDNHIAGAIAQADNLGIFGSRGVYAAAFWPTSASYPFILAGFKMYCDYDGNLGRFGDISISASSSDASNVVAYVSRDSSRPNRCAIVAINRSSAAQDVGFAGLALSGTARVYRVEGTQTSPVFIGEVPVHLASWVVTLPALSVSTIEITQTAAGATYNDWRADHFSVADQHNETVSGPSADPEGIGLPNLLRYAFNLSAHGYVRAPLVPQLVLSGGQPYFAATFSRRTNATDVAYLVHGCSDLANWTPLTAIFAGAPAQVTVQDAVTIASAPCRFFLCVRVRYAP